MVPEIEIVEPLEYASALDETVNAGLGSVAAKAELLIPYDKIERDNNANAKNPASLIFNFFMV